MSGLELKCGKAFASFELYKYLVDHSYRANKHLDELHEVCMLLKAMMTRPRYNSDFVISFLCFALHQHKADTKWAVLGNCR